MKKILQKELAAHPPLTDANVLELLLRCLADLQQMRSPSVVSRINPNDVEKWRWVIDNLEKFLRVYWALQKTVSDMQSFLKKRAKGLARSDAMFSGAPDMAKTHNDLD